MEEIFGLADLGKEPHFCEYGLDVVKTSRKVFTPWISISLHTCF